MTSKIQLRKQKFAREDIIPKLIAGQITRAKAAQALCLSLRRVDQLKKSYKELGAAAFVPKQTERKPRRTYQEEDKQRFIQLIQEKFCDFGPTLIKYQLFKMLSEKIPCKETLRQWMIEANLHQAHQKKVCIDCEKEKSTMAP